MRHRSEKMLRRLANDLRLLLLLPFLLLVLVSERVDPHLWRYWNMRSLANWRQFRWQWTAYALSMIGWGIAATGLHYLVRWISK